MAQLSLRRMAGLAGIAGLVASGVPPVAGQDATGNTLLRMEADVIFPRNETYKQTDVLPIAFAVQNFTHLPALGGFKFIWDIMPYTKDGSIPGDSVIDSGDFLVPDDAGSNSTDKDPVILVGVTNATALVKRMEYGERFMLQLFAYWQNASPSCESETQDHNLARVMFSIETDRDLDLDPNSTAIAADIANAPDCPAFGALVSVQPYVASTVATVLGGETFRCPYSVGFNDVAASATPCAVTVDAAAKSSIGSRASSLATAAYRATQPARPTPTSTNAAVAAGRPTLAPALAAVGVVCCLVYY